MFGIVYEVRTKMSNGHRVKCRHNWGMSMAPQYTDTRSIIRGPVITCMSSHVKLKMVLNSTRTFIIIYQYVLV